jgi:hypothetical protein
MTINYLAGNRGERPTDDLRGDFDLDRFPRGRAPQCSGVRALADGADVADGAAPLVGDLVEAHEARRLFDENGKLGRFVCMTPRGCCFPALRNAPAPRRFRPEKGPREGLHALRFGHIMSIMVARVPVLFFVFLGAAPGAAAARWGR